MRALKPKDRWRIKKQYSDICIDSAIRQHYAEKGHKQGMKEKAFEAKQLKRMTENFERSFNKPEFAQFFAEAKNQVVIWEKNKYTQNHSGALVQLQVIAERYPEVSDLIAKWCLHQKLKFDYALKMAQKNNFEEATQE